MSTFQLKISTPEGLRFDGEAERIVVRGALGDLAILARHIPMMTPVRAGACRVVLPDGRVHTGKTQGGLLTVGRDRVIALLSDWDEQETFDE
ncbi:MAG: F0F1 ATP synthase subunit epsilon [Clostridia bacterium]|nr:F0F1 ATP synthase subunit epsilon [Clostridia bacterium]